MTLGELKLSRRNYELQHAADSRAAFLPGFVAVESKISLGLGKLHERLAELHLPEPNPFIPQDLRLRPVLDPTISSALAEINATSKRFADKILRNTMEKIIPVRETRLRPAQGVSLVVLIVSTLNVSSLIILSFLP